MKLFSAFGIMSFTVLILAASLLSAKDLHTHVYQGNSIICFLSDDQDALSVTIDTERIHLRSIEESEEERIFYFMLFSDPEVMEKYATGRIKTKEEIQHFVKNCARRWREKDPYSAFAVFKNSTGEFIGNVMIGHGKVPGQSELAFVFMKKYWGMGYGTEAVTAVVKEYVPATIDEGYTLVGKVIEKITATARPDNPASLKILEKIGMHKIGEEIKFGALRYEFSIDLIEILMNSKRPLKIE